MKKLILPVIAAASLLAVSTSAFAQGQVTFANTATTRVTISPVGGNTSNMYGAAGTYEFGLYAGSSAGSMTLVGTLFNSSIAASTTFNAGLFSVGNFTLPTQGTTFDGSAPIFFQVKGWSASYGSSYDAAYNNNTDGLGLFGFSAVGTVTPVIPGGSTPVPALFGTGAGQVGGFNLHPVPEPTTLALAGLGAASLLLFRRRK